MLRAAIYKFNNGYIIHSSSKTVAGFNISSEPYIRLDKDTTIEEIVNSLHLALKASKQGLPTPTNWKDSTHNFLKSTGIKSLKELHEDSVKYCGVDLIGAAMVFTPSQHATPPEKDFYINRKVSQLKYPQRLVLRR